ncbi:MAG: vWA domain-containing protein [Planctomycetota bacterium]|jgi:hypothetical protein
MIATKNTAARTAGALISSLSALGLLLMLSAPAAAQTGTGGTGAGTGTTAPAPSASTEYGDEIDLPIGAPVDDNYIEDPEPEPNEDDPQLYGEDLPSESDSIIYVLDISGSMDWGTSSYTGLDGNPTSGTKIQRAKVELRRSIRQLTDDFEFNIVGYDCSMRRWAGQRREATAQNKTSAEGWVNGLRTGGATGTGPAGALALQEKDNMTVVILSDGAPNCGANGFGGHLSMITSANTQGAIIHTFGIGATGQFASFLRSIADSSGGRYVSIP